MNNTVLYVLNRVLPLLPDTRLYPLRARLWRAAGVDIHPSAMMVSTVRIMGRFHLSIGEHSHVGHEVMIVGGDASIFIGSQCDIGPRVTIVNGSHQLGHVHGSRRAAGDGVSSPIAIQSGVWIGAGSTILGGANIGERAVIGAGSVVTGDIPADTIAVGTPCRPVKHWDEHRRVWRECR